MHAKAVFYIKKEVFRPEVEKLGPEGLLVLVAAIATLRKEEISIL